MSGGSGYGEISGEEGGDGESGACDPVTDASLDGNFRVLRQGLDEVRRGVGSRGIHSVHIWYICVCAVPFGILSS